MKHIFTISICFLALSLSAQNYPLEVEAYQAHSTTEGLAFLDGMTTYRFYITNLGPTDFVSSIFGNNDMPFEFSAPEGIYNTSLNASWGTSGISPGFIELFPQMEFDSYATIGLTTSASTSGIAGAADVAILEDPSQQITPMFTINGSTGATVNSVQGMAYYILNGNPVGLPDGVGRVLIMQITTSGTISGTLNAQIFPNGIGADFLTYAYLFDGAGTFGGNTGVAGCTDITACNFSAEATVDNELCDYSCCPGPGCCSEGLYWDWDAEECYITNPSDINLDGCVQLDDLLDLLVDYGDCAVSGFTFTCGDFIFHEGNYYSTVQIGDQCWFGDNCRYLPVVSPSSEGSLTEPYYYVYGYEGTDITAAQASSSSNYGVLYNWPAVMTEGICPSGWHIPTDLEWQTMEMAIGMSIQEANYTGWRGTNQGYQMKSTSGWYNNPNLSESNGSNSSGFNGKPGGFRDDEGGFLNLSLSASFWSASESGSNSWIRGLFYYLDTVRRDLINRGNGASARCLQD